jgi:hypothetical protein
MWPIQLAFLLFILCGIFLPSIVEMSKDTQVVRGVSEQQTAKHEWGYSTQEDTRWQQGHMTEKFR